MISRLTVRLSLLRTASRHFATRAHAVIRAPVSLANTSKKSVVQLSSSSSFSTNTNTNTLSTAREDLVAALQKEHRYEIDEGGGTEMGPEVMELMDIVVKKSKWQILDDGGPFTKIQRNHNTMQILLSFHCQDLLYEDSDEQNENEQEDEIAPPANPEQDYPPGSLRFTATATPTKSGKTLIFQCTAECGSVRIDAVSVGDGEVDVDKLHTEDAKYDEYVGPVFAELDEKLKEEFQRFLELDVGIDTDMATFMNAYADYKEQQHYVKFLDECQKALAPE